MPINQLFKNMPDRSFVITLINLYGIVDFDDNKYFTKNTLETLNTVENLNNMSDKLKEYYIDCKSNTYLKDITLKRSIVILRQFLRCHGYTLFSKEKFIKGKKQTIYKIVKLDTEVVLPKKKKKIIVSFE
jgi:hypothetical protein|tara:strand:+ start:218 stop:607 length:390 start_codon:yes stop_codon:yes gene_type:complete